MLTSPSLQILAEVTVRLYHAKFSGVEYEWQYFNQQGTVQFCESHNEDVEPDHNPAEESRASPKLTEAQGYWFRLRDNTTGRILWTFSIPEECIYRIDKPFFHIFNGRSRMWGFLFEKDEDAQVFGQIVQIQLPTSPAQQALQQKVYNSKSAIKDPGRAPSIRSEKSSKSRFGRIAVINASTPTLVSTQQVASTQKALQSISGLTPAVISLPQTDSFVHIGHIGLGGDGVIECSEGIDPSWSTVITDLQTRRNFAPDVLKRKEFISSLRIGIKKIGPAAMRSGCF